MVNGASTAASEKRIYWMDNLRTVIIFLVVLYHAGGVYESGDAWTSFWLVDDPATNDVVSIFLIMFDIFMMPILFFISGYLTPMSLKNKTGWGFLKGKFRRLMVPWAVAVLTLIPLYKVIFLYSRGLSQEHWTTYFHFSNPNISSQSWLWFLPVLFGFNLLYILLSRVKLLPEKVSFKVSVIAACVFGLVYTLSFDLTGARGWFGSPILDFQKERLPMYFMVFLLGALAYKQRLFVSEPGSKTLYNIANYASWVPVTAYILFLLMPFIAEDGVLITWFVDRAIVWVSFYLSLLSLMIIMLETFRRYLNKPGRLWSELNRNSYGVYIIHVIVIGVFGTLLLNLNVSALVKYPLLILSAYSVSNLLVSIYRRGRAALKATRTPAPSPTVDVA